MSYQKFPQTNYFPGNIISQHNFLKLTDFWQRRVNAVNLIAMSKSIVKARLVTCSSSGTSSKEDCYPSSQSSVSVPTLPSQSFLTILIKFAIYTDEFFLIVSFSSNAPPKNSGWKIKRKENNDRGLRLPHIM